MDIFLPEQLKQLQSIYEKALSESLPNIQDRTDENISVFLENSIIEIDILLERLKGFLKNPELDSKHNIELIYYNENLKKYFLQKIKLNELRMKGEQLPVETFNANDIIDDKAIEGKEDANTFYVKVSIDRRLTAKQINDKLNESYENARERMMKAENKLKEKKTLPLLCDASYWRSYHQNLEQYIHRKKVENKKKKTLSDYFTHTDMSFNDFLNVIERAGLSDKGEIKSTGISHKAKAVYEVLAKDRNILEDSRTEFVIFRDAFTMHFCNLKRGSSSYSNPDDKGNVERHKKSLNEVFNKSVKV